MFFYEISATLPQSRLYLIVSENVKCVADTRGRSIFDHFCCHICHGVCMSVFFRTSHFCQIMLEKIRK